PFPKYRSLFIPEGGDCSDKGGRRQFLPRLQRRESPCRELVNTSMDFSHSDDVRKYVPQLRADNMEANQPVLDLLKEYAERKDATMAQISLAWMLRKAPNIVPIPGSKNKERILENLGTWNVDLTDQEFAALEAALDAIPVHGHRGYVEMEGTSMSSWGTS
ncbi:MAG: hypothetical protein HDQ87_00835, partial [Clostridia bacterium]|nr:hypothetical protein [Clostridia bacterium]